MIGQHIYMRCLVGGFAKDAVVNPGSRTAACTPGILAENDVAFSIEPKCTLEDRFANSSGLLNSPRNVLKIYHPVERCTVATRISWVTDRITDGRSSSYAFSHILTGADHDAILRRPAALFRAEQYEPYASAAGRLLQNPQAKLQLDESMRLKPETAAGRPGEILTRCGFDFAAFSLYVAGLIQQTSEKDGRFYVVLPAAAQDTWGNGDDLTEQLMRATLELMPLMIRKNITMVSHWPFNDSSMLVQGIRLVFCRADDEETRQAIRRSSAVMLDVAGRSGRNLPDERCRDFARFLWQNSDDPAALAAFEQYVQSLCGDYLDRLIINESLVADWFCMWESHRQGHADPLLVRNGIYAAARAFAGAIGRFAQVEAFMFEALGQLKAQNIDAGMEEALVLLMKKGRSPLSYYGLLLDLLLQAVERGSAGPDTVLALRDELARFPEQTVKPVLDLLQRHLSGTAADARPGASLLRFIIAILELNPRDPVGETAWLVFRNWCERIFLSGDPDQMAAALDYLFAAGSARRWHETLGIGPAAHAGIFQATQADRGLMKKAAENCLHQDATYFLHDARRYEAVLVSYLERPDAALNQALLLPLYGYWSRQPDLQPCERHYRALIAQFKKPENSFPERQRIFISEQETVFRFLATEHGLELIQNLFSALDAANLQLGLTEAAAQRHIRAVIDLFGSQRESRFERILTAYIPYLAAAADQSAAFVKLVAEKQWLCACYIQTIAEAYDRQYPEICGLLAREIQTRPNMETELLTALGRMDPYALSEQSLNTILEVYRKRLTERPVGSLTAYMNAIDHENNLLQAVLAPYAGLREQLEQLQFEKIQDHFKSFTDDDLMSLSPGGLQELHKVMTRYKERFAPEVTESVWALTGLDSAVQTANFGLLEKICQRVQRQQPVLDLMAKRLNAYVADGRVRPEILRGCCLFATLLAQYPIAFRPLIYLSTLARPGDGPAAKAVYGLELLTSLGQYTNIYHNMVYEAMESKVRQLLDDDPALKEDRLVRLAAAGLRDGTLKTSIGADRPAERFGDSYAPAAQPIVIRRLFGLSDYLLCLAAFLICAAVAAGLVWLLLLLYRTSPITGMLSAAIALLLAVAAFLFLSLAKQSKRNRF